MALWVVTAMRLNVYLLLCCFLCSPTRLYECCVALGGISNELNNMIIMHILSLLF